MTAILQRDIGLNEPQKCFMDHRRRLQSVAAPFAPHVVAGESAQFVIDQRRQSIQSLRMARPPLRQQLREIGWDLHRRLSQS